MIVSAWLQRAITGLAVVVLVMAAGVRPAWATSC
jgi:hypothetical protein